MNLIPIINQKTKLFHNLVGTLRESFNETADWKGNREEFFRICIPYNFQLQQSKFFYIMVYEYDSSFSLSLCLDPKQVSRSHHLDCVVFRTPAGLSRNGN